MSDQPTAESPSGSTPDPIPLLPHGAVVFDAIPLAAVVMHALAPVIRDGTLVVRDRDRGAVILVRGGAVLEAHVFDGATTREGAGLIKEVQTWSGALVWAERLDHALVELCRAMLRGDALYDDLRLSWIAWPALLADLRRRGGTYVVEISTPSGRGVTCIAAGRQALSYTDIHPSLGDPALLEAMASNKEGEVRVRRVEADAFDDIPQTRPSAAAPATPAVAAAEPRGALPGRDPQVAGGTNGTTNGSNGAAHQEQLAGGARDWPATTWERPTPAADQPATPQAAAAPSTPVVTETLADVAWVAPWDTPWREEGAAATPAEAPAEAQPSPWAFHEPRDGDGAPVAVTVGEVLGDLRTIVQRRLQLSASRVEAVLDEGALEQRSLAAVLDEIRAMSIRGVMPATVEEMVDEMAAAAAERRPSE